MDQTRMQASEGQQGMPERGGGPFRSLSAKLLGLTILFVLLAEVLIFLPSVSNMRIRWLQDRLSAAAAAGIVIDALQPEDLPEKARNETLMAAGARAIALRSGVTSQLLAATPIDEPIAGVYDLGKDGTLENLQAAIDTLLFGGHRLIRAHGPVGDSQMIIDMVLDETALRDAMLVYSRNVALFSIAISLITSTLIFFAIDRLLIRRIRRLTLNMQGFARDPDNPAAVLQPSGGKDELDLAELHLSSMQAELQRTLHQQKTLAELGLAVSKINHDMRNILATAQLLSDRLTDVDDPMVKAFAPKLIRTLDRAVGYTSEVLAYGQMTEQVPRRSRQPLARVVQEVRDNLGLDPASAIQFVIDMDENLDIDSDPEHLFRILHNLARNAHQALAGAGTDPGIITMTASRQGKGTLIEVDDNGPGMPPKARENLFAAFRGAARTGGTGLGLAIARDLVQAHGGTIELVAKTGPGTRFRLLIPDRPGVAGADDFLSH